MSLHSGTAESGGFIPRREFGLGGVYLSGGVALDGEELWAATEKGVLHWDGQRWKSYGEVRNGSSTVAAKGQVSVIEESGELWHFDGTQWTNEKVDLPGENVPELARTSDGTLWILRDGLWRREGSAWRTVKSDSQDFKYMDLVGTAGDRSGFGTAGN